MDVLWQQASVENLLCQDVWVGAGYRVIERDHCRISPPRGVACEQDGRKVEGRTSCNSVKEGMRAVEVQVC